VLPHQIAQFTPEDDDSDYDDMYVPYSNMISNDLEPEEMEYGYVNALERGDDVNGVDSGIPVPEEEGRKYQNLWLSEDDPRAVPLPAIICPVHRYGCKKGICEDMSKMLKEIKRAELKKEWEEENLKKNKGTHFFILLSLTNENLPD
jgi:hypothetical protein